MAHVHQTERVEGASAITSVSFDEFYAANYRDMVGLGYVLTGNMMVAEDLVQDAFAEAHRRWDRVSTYDQPGGWVRRVLVNKSTSRGRRLVSEAKAITRLRSRRAMAVPLTEPTSDLWAAVRRLPKRQAQVIALKYWNDMTISQIAATLELKPETVKTHLKRARSALAESREVADLRADDGFGRGEPELTEGVSQ